MSKAKIVELDESNICALCRNAFAKYSCPKCGVKYCSLVCYRSTQHLECSEEFYKSCVVENLETQQDEASKNMMLEILKRNQTLTEEQDSDLDSDDDEVATIADRLAGVDLDNTDKVWEKLTRDEQQDFLAFLKSGDVSKLIPPWQPWWSYVSQSVEEVDCPPNFKKCCPEIVNISNFSEISKVDPAACVTYNLVNVLAAYAFTVRYFNGEHHDFCHEVASCVVTISLSFKHNQNFEDFEGAIKSVEFQCTESEWVMADMENFKMMREDVSRILQGPQSTNKKHYILCAMSDLYRLLKEALHKKRHQSAFSKKLPNDYFPDIKLESKNKIRMCLRKTEYLLSFAKDHFIL